MISPPTDLRSPSHPVISYNYQSLETEVRIYPNPVQSILTIQWGKGLANFMKRIDLSPYNSEAVENVSFRHSEYKTTLDMTDKASGVYYIKIHFVDGSIIN